ncbi:MAG: nuclear transport factor 2 family protein, partial [Acidobacteria bacterium]|nr:nuclear transport factor 2 family protein [Acidobacteriota bacterium]
MNILVPVLMVMFAFHPSPSSPIQSTSTGAQARQQVLDLENGWIVAYLNKDAAFFERTLHPDLIHFGFDGERASRTDWLAFFRTGDWKYESARLKELEVRAFTDAAVVSGVMEREIAIGTRRISGPVSFTHVWVREQGRWLLLRSHVSSPRPRP